MSTLTLHIINGDGTFFPFQKSGISGQTAIWREMFCEGPTGQLSSPSFWKQREEFLSSKYPSENKYTEIVLPEWEKIKQFADFQEVVLWFEHDLFCQLNLIGLLSWFADQNLEHVKLSMVSPSKHEKHPNFQGMGQLAPEDFPPLYQERTPISKETLDIAKKVWNLYSASDANELWNYSLTTEFKGLPHLKTALQIHFERFPNKRTGLNTKESFILSQFANAKSLSTRELMRSLLLNGNTLWGLGDAQYFRMLEDLKPLIEKNNEFELTSLGENVLAQISSFENHRNTELQIGGANQTDWYWDDNKNLCRSESD